MASLLPLVLLSFLVTYLSLISLTYALDYKPNPLSSYLPSNIPRKMLNPIDSCWRTKPNWAANRHTLADCAVGFGRGAVGGKNGTIYRVTTPDDDPVSPKLGTLRYGVIQPQPLWIIFDKNMLITLKNELIVNSYKTIDGRGAKVEIAYGPCITIEKVSHVIIHGITIHDCKPAKPGLVRSSPKHVGHRQGSDGDGVAIFASSNVWIDHCFISHCTDGLIDVIHASTSITISNNFFSHHDKVMLLGHKDGYTPDKIMKVTIAFNHFGPGLTERMPRVRFGYAHVANNLYEKWRMYAIGGSSNPTIFSEGNYFIAPDDPSSKEVTKREATPKNVWRKWKWGSSKDVLENGATFLQSGYGSCAPLYSEFQSFPVARGTSVRALTSDAGPLGCVLGIPYCW